MAKADLTAARLRELFHYDPETGQFTRLGGAPGGTGSNSNGYLAMYVAGRRYRLHRLAWLYVTGNWPTQLIDHKNGNRSDNRFANLRDVSQSINRENQHAVRSNNLSAGITGVSWCEYHKKYKAHIRVGGRLQHLKYCASAEEARAVYLEAKRRLHPGCTV
jgi:hypothetical protein